MTPCQSQDYGDPRIAAHLVEQIRNTLGVSGPLRLMEVCGTHTMAIFRHGIRSLLPDGLTLLSGPGCPVCVTDQQEIDAMIALSQRDDVMVATFGDLIRVPGSYTSLQKEIAEGADVRVVYSAMDAVQLACQHPQKNVVFIGVGFETTAPTVAAAIMTAKQLKLTNFTVFAAHKTVPPALTALMRLPQVAVDGFLLPGHVSVIIGVNGYRSFFAKHRIPCVIAGFEPTDILQAILMVLQQFGRGDRRLENGYARAVCDQGNPKAREVMHQVFEPCEARWRGLGTIPASGLVIRKEYAAFDAVRRFKPAVVEMKPPKGCACGQILTGVKTPVQCALFRTHCTPLTPVGPCMVSTEGTCAAYYRYHE